MRGEIVYDEKNYNILGINKKLKEKKKILE
jgi:hypothetical protein